MVLWVVLKNKADAEAFEQAFEDSQKIIDNVWLVYHTAPKDTPNPGLFAGGGEILRQG